MVLPTVAFRQFGRDHVQHDAVEGDRHCREVWERRRWEPSGSGIVVLHGVLGRRGLAAPMVIGGKSKAYRSFVL
jgi:hypothetical protein